MVSPDRGLEFYDGTAWYPPQNLMIGQNRNKGLPFAMQNQLCHIFLYIDNNVVLTGIVVID